MKDELNEVGRNEAVEKINKTKIQFLKNTSKMNQPLARLINKKVYTN